MTYVVRCLSGRFVNVVRLKSYPPLSLSDIPEVHHRKWSTTTIAFCESLGCSFVALFGAITTLRRVLVYTGYWIHWEGMRAVVSAAGDGPRGVHSAGIRFTLD
ncbi:hypothetical protein LSAT2_022683 [Lamellibrachia satsuma]|nr:hypothetical protein LSAT2_022683 [Lamellibrachia satsuma]